MQGFIYLWHDKVRNMFYIGSHDGTPDDGYISSSRWLNAEYNYRPADFRRRIIKFISLTDMKLEEYRLIKMISDAEFGIRYYNLKSGRKPGTAPWNKGKSNVYSDTTLSKMSAAKIGKQSPTKGKLSPSSANNGKKGAKKLSQTVTGRRIAVRPDGTRYWIKLVDSVSKSNQQNSDVA